MTKARVGFFILWMAAAWAGMCRAADVYVVKTGAAKVGLDLSGLKPSGSAASALFLQTLQSDLDRSGWFTIVGAGSGAIAVRGRCGDAGQSLRAEIDVRGVRNGEAFLNKAFSGSGDRARRLAHEVADEIVWAVKKVRGMASSRIAMVGTRGGKKNMYLCDADGGNHVQITKDGSTCLGPTWARDGASLIYTSFFGGFPDIYRIDLGSYRREKIAGFPGLNMGSSVSPDGRSLALTLSKDGNPDLYVLNLGSGRLTGRLTRSRRAAEASPSWSPDGRQIVYVSDRAGSPQLYVMGRDGTGEQRISFRGNENVSPEWGPDGRIAWSSKRGGRYQICVMNPSDRAETQITSEYVDFEDPSWAPDGRHIVCTRTTGYRPDLYILDTLGDPPVRLTTVTGEWYCPAWSSK